jgi:hypothetical protein
MIQAKIDDPGRPAAKGSEFTYRGMRLASFIAAPRRVVSVLLDQQIGRAPDVDVRNHQLGSLKPYLTQAIEIDLSRTCEGYRQAISSPWAVLYEPTPDQRKSLWPIQTLWR